MAQPILLLETLLVAAGIIFLILEFKAPGHVASGVVAVLCFAAFFGLHFYLGGHLVIAAVAFCLLGLTLIGIELFLLPGHAIAGVSGVLILVAGLALAGTDRLPETTGDWADLTAAALRHTLTVAAAGIVAFQLTKHLSDVPVANRLLLVPPDERAESDEMSAPAGEAATEALIGQVGVTTSALRPAGTARLAGRRADVSTEWGFLESGTPVRVVGVEGSRIVVERV